MDRGKRDFRLYDFILPIIFFEIRYVFLGFIGVVIIETIIIAFVMKENLAAIWKRVLLANFVTTISGYLGQGLMRIGALMVAAPIFEKIMGNKFFDNRFLAGIFGKFGDELL